MLVITNTTDFSSVETIADKVKTGDDILQLTPPETALDTQLVED